MKWKQGYKSRRIILWVLCTVSWFAGRFVMSYICSRTKQILSLVYVVNIGTVLDSPVLQIVMIGGCIVYRGSRIDSWCHIYPHARNKYWAWFMWLTLALCFIHICCKSLWLGAEYGRKLINLLHWPGKWCHPRVYVRLSTCGRLR